MPDENGYQHTTSELQCLLAEEALRERKKINDEHIRLYISSDLLYTIYHFTLRWSTLELYGCIEI